ncbi:short-chain dehydrogenase [Burkholderia cepacia]|uniref:L-rhamnose 1-dehydrogenase (NAD(P)(+)) n=1 Tax=Burkholderia cepacia TaxID=292 RepID=A0A2S8IFY8_BURCE|nr:MULTISPECIES: SDR family NAD(P)-dependent oxidoreductase [Burkholderia cepacia complex]PQP13671.1 short-chain dehydrogenase [Burkholderia cepacia]UOB60149.1 SDR family oxidoreductase [Burkholderia pyrrocinia]HDR9510319.1 SDR family oxidoreductase [Burkholderia cepacia]
MKLLENKVVVVTGGSRGIGRAIALACARHGADVVVNYWANPLLPAQSDHALDALVDEIGATGRRALAVPGDIARPDTADELVARAVDAFGRIDVLASNAGICPFHAFLDLPADLLRRTMEVNLHGAFHVTQAVARRMAAQGDGGAIVATSSISALVGGGMQTHYTPTKAGVHALMQSCAVALGPHRIRCNSVLPGTIRTEINEADLAAPGKAEYFEQRIPLGRLGEPDDVADCVVFLASDLARYVNGAALLVDGGLYVNLQ